MTEKQTKVKTVFAVINLAHSEQEQHNVAQYAMQLAQHLGLRVVLYPKRNETGLSFQEGVDRVNDIAKQLPDIDIIVSKTQSNIFNLFQSLHTIAQKEQAKFIIMGVKKEQAAPLGRAIWESTQKSFIKTIFLPVIIGSASFDNITIAVDATRKVQKLKIVNQLVRTFDSTIHVFVEHAPKESEERCLIQNNLKHVLEYLSIRRIRFLVIQARKIDNYSKRLCKYSRKHSDILIVEVDPGKIESIVKQNIEMLLCVEKYATPVMMVKTHITGNYQNFS